MPYFSFDGFPVDGFHAPDEAAVVDGVGLMPPGAIKAVSDQTAPSLAASPLFTEHDAADYDAQQADRAAARNAEIEAEMKSAAEPETEQDSAPHDDPTPTDTPVAPASDAPFTTDSTPSTGVKHDA